MPKPKSGESKDDFIDRCIPIVIRDGTAKDGSQARAVCESLWDRKAMGVTVDQDTHKRLKELVQQGHYDATVGKWAFAQEDADAVSNHAYLGSAPDPEDENKQVFTYPVAKIVDGKLTLFRSGVIAAKHRASEVGDHKVEAAADALLDQIDGTNTGDNPMPDKLHEMKGVEIFRAGKWNGDEFTQADLDEMVANFAKVGFEPPVKLGHDDKPDARAFGFVKALRREGDKLVADLKDVPEKVVDLIKEKAFNTVSSEIFFNLKRNGETFRRALAGVALLGGQVPAVSGLKPLSDAVPFSADDAEATRYYDLEVNQMPDDDVKELRRQLQEAQNEVQRLKQNGGTEEELRRKMEAQEQRIAELHEAQMQSYIKDKLADFPVPALKPHMEYLYDLSLRTTEKRSFAQADKDGNVRTEEVPPETVLDRFCEYLKENTTWLFTEASRHTEGNGESPQDQVDRLAHKKKAESGGKMNYSEALNAVLEEHPDLARQYAEAQE